MLRGILVAVSAMAWTGRAASACSNDPNEPCLVVHDEDADAASASVELPASSVASNPGLGFHVVGTRRSSTNASDEPAAPTEADRVHLVFPAELSSTPAITVPPALEGPLLRSSDERVVIRGSTQSQTLPISPAPSSTLFCTHAGDEPVLLVVERPLSLTESEEWGALRGSLASGGSLETRCGTARRNQQGEVSFESASSEEPCEIFFAHACAPRGDISTMGAADALRGFGVHVIVRPDHDDDEPGLCTSAAGPSPTATAPLRFVDAAARLGVRGNQRPTGHKTPPECAFPSWDEEAQRWDPGAFCFIELMLGGVAVGDVNGDDLPDIFLARYGGPDLLLLNQGAGQGFRDGSEDAGLHPNGTDSNGALFVDIDADGDLDIYVSTVGRSSFVLYVNDGHGHFVDDAEARGLSNRKLYAVGDPRQRLLPRTLIDEFAGRARTFGAPDLLDRLQVAAVSAPWGVRVVALDEVGIRQALREAEEALAAARRAEAEAQVADPEHRDPTHPVRMLTTQILSRVAENTVARIRKAMGDSVHTTGFTIAVGDYDLDGFPDLYTTDWHPLMSYPLLEMQDASAPIPIQGRLPPKATHTRLFRNLGSSGRPGYFEEVTAQAGVKIGSSRFMHVDFTSGGLLTLLETLSTAKVGKPGSPAAQAAESLLERVGLLDQVRRQFPVVSRRAGAAAAGTGLIAAAELSSVFARTFPNGKPVSADDQEAVIVDMMELGRAERASLGVKEPATPFRAAFLVHNFSSEGAFEFGASFRDLDLDGYQDLIISGDFGSSQLYWNNGNGTFTRGFFDLIEDMEDNSMGCTIEDFDGDGLPDVLFSSVIVNPRLVYDLLRNYQNAGFVLKFRGNHLYRNLGNRRFVDVTDDAGVRVAGWAWGAALFDADNDGDRDAFFTNGLDDPETTDDDFATNQPNMFYLAEQHRNADAPIDAEFVEQLRRVSVAAVAVKPKDSDGRVRVRSPVRFRNVAPAVGLDDRRDGRGVAVLDVDGDGDQDLLTIYASDEPAIYENLVGGQNSWVRVMVREPVFTTNPAGQLTIDATRVTPSTTAIVWVFPSEDHPDWRLLGLAGNSAAFLGQNEDVVHFGLGPGLPVNASLHRLVVHWPVFNATRVYYDVPTRTTLRAMPPPQRALEFARLRAEAGGRPPHGSLDRIVEHVTYTAGQPESCKRQKT